METQPGFVTEQVQRPAGSLGFTAIGFYGQQMEVNAREVIVCWRLGSGVEILQSALKAKEPGLRPDLAPLSFVRSFIVTHSGGRRHVSHCVSVTVFRQNKSGISQSITVICRREFKESGLLTHVPLKSLRTKYFEH